MIEVKLIEHKRESIICNACHKNNAANSNLYDIIINAEESSHSMVITLCNDCLKELRRKIVVREVKMTPKQRDYINFIEEMTGVQFKDGDNISDYINKNKAEAHRKWLQQCELDAIADGRENAGDRE